MKYICKYDRIYSIYLTTGQRDGQKQPEPKALGVESGGKQDQVAVLFWFLFVFLERR